VEFVLGGIFRGLRWVFQRFWIFMGLLAAYFLVTAGQVWLTSRHSDPIAAQAAVVMAAPEHGGVASADLVARLQDADDLWHRHLAPLLVVTGIDQAADHSSVAGVSESWLVAHGVTATDVVAAGGTGTWKNLSGAAAVLHRRGLTRVLVVTDGFQEDRSLAIATQVGLKAKPVPVADSPIKGWSKFPYFAKETVSVAVGRVVGYSRLGDMGEASVSAVSSLSVSPVLPVP